jgi:hypothetical protein
MRRRSGGYTRSERAGGQTMIRFAALSTAGVRRRDSIKREVSTKELCDLEDQILVKEVFGNCEADVEARGRLGHV